MNDPLARLKKVMAGGYRPFSNRREDITWTPESQIWVDSYFYYRVNFEVSPFSFNSAFDQIKYNMMLDQSWGTYRQDWGGWVSDNTHSFYFNDMAIVEKFLKTYANRYPQFGGLTWTPWLRGKYGEITDAKTLEEFNVEFPYCVEISLEHDGQDIQDWLVGNGMTHHGDWKAIRMAHKKVWAIYFREATKATMTKLRWGGIGF